MRRCEGLLLSWVRRPCRIHSTTATSTQIRHLVSTLRAPPHLPDTRGNSHDKKTNMGGEHKHKEVKHITPSTSSQEVRTNQLHTNEISSKVAVAMYILTLRRQSVPALQRPPPKKTRDIKVCPRDRKAVHIPRLIKYRSLPSNNERTSNYSLSTAISRFGSRNQLQLHGTNRLVHITPPRARFLQTSDHVSIKPAGVPSVASGRQEQLLSHSKYQRHPATAE